MRIFMARPIRITVLMVILILRHFFYLQINLRMIQYSCRKIDMKLPYVDRKEQMMNRILHRISPRLIALLSALIMLLSVLPAYAAGSDIDGDIDGDDVVISKVGDINADGSVDVKDLVRLMKYISGADVTICGSDVNGDGVTDTRDLVRLMRIIAAA